MSTDLTDNITDAATKPAEAESDSRRIKARTIDEMIAADKYAKQNAALAGGNSGWNALRPARIIPPGTIGERNTQ